jgi:hypothetical protein
MSPEADVTSEAKAGINKTYYLYGAQARSNQILFIHIFTGLALSVLLVGSRSLEALIRKCVEATVASDADTSIFVGIASYVDPEVDRTIELLFAQAKEPSRVHVGLVLQEHKSSREVYP